MQVLPVWPTQRLSDTQLTECVTRVRSNRSHQCDNAVPSKNWIEGHIQAINANCCRFWLKCWQHMQTFVLFRRLRRTKFWPCRSWKSPRCNSVSRRYEYLQTKSIRIMAVLISLPALRKAQERMAYDVLLMFFIFIYSLVIYVNYLNIQRTDLHRICTDGRTMAV